MHVHKKPGWTIKIPLIVLGCPLHRGRLVNIPPWLGNKPAFTDFLGLALPPASETRAGLVLRAWL